MNSGMVENPVKVVLDTNILLSAIGFGGKPAEILSLVLKERITAVTSPILLAELEEALRKVLPLSKNDIELILDEIDDEFETVLPRFSIKTSRDEDDNRVLEAAVEGNCEYIITGDKDLLTLKKYKNIKILTAEQFLLEIKPT